MKQEKIARQIDKARKDLQAIITDLSEVTVLADIDFQAARIKKVKEDLDKASTQIHGGGTGNE